MACVHKAPATSEYKLLQLRQYITGDAMKVIQDLGHSAAAYDVALDRLERKYGGKRRQVTLQLSNFRPIRPGNVRDIERFADMLDIVVINIRDTDRLEELGSGALYNQLLKKMTESMLTDYHRWVFDRERQESVETLREWVLQEAELSVMASETLHGLSKKGKTIARGQSKSGSFFGDRQTDMRVQCALCKNSHHIWKCKQFKLMSVPDRWETAKKLNLCFRCLGTNHQAKSCNRRITCGIDNCAASHNRFLHSTKRCEATETKKQKQHDTQSPPVVTMSSSESSRSTLLSLRTVPVVLKNGNKRIIVNALLDDASTQTYINRDAALELGLSGPSQKVSVNVLNGQHEMLDTMSVQVGLESLDGSVNTTIYALTTTRVTGQMQVVDWRKIAGRWKHIENIDFPKVTSPHIIDLLIGMDYLELHRSYQDIIGKEGDPIARLTPLGWTCVGRIPGFRDVRHNAGTYFTDNREIELSSMLQKLWEVDDVPSVTSTLSKDDESVLASVKDTVKFENGRYQIGIPWKESVSPLPDNWDIAYKRLCNTEKKLSKNEQVAVTYDGIISHYVEKGYIEKVSLDENNSSRGWYLPHFPVVRPDRETTKVRIVFDASAKCEGVSLNDTIHQGPKLQGDLFQILLRFRRYPVAIVCDIAEMYLQIEMLPKDKSFFRFLWRSNNQNERPDIYQFSRVVFGVNASPFLAQYITQEHARRFQDTLPKAAETVFKSTYMDDNIDSVRNELEAIELYEQLSELWGNAGMCARKWLSNSPEVLQRVPIENRATEVDLGRNELPTAKTLGLTWVAKDDEFSFHNTNAHNNWILTKRGFLRELAKVFDPLGFVAPFIITAKILMQEIWLKGLDWDEELQTGLKQKALLWLSQLKELESVTIPRCLQFSLDIENRRLHVFVDASEKAYGAVVYSVTTYQNGTKTSRLTASKSRVAPLKSVSIPRMELVAAVLGVKLILPVLKALEMNIAAVTLWTDSQNVLCWIKNHSRKFKTFVANRVAFIQEYTTPSQWKYVPSLQNPSDVLSRGATIADLKGKAWMSGPDFLEEDVAEEPTQTVITPASDDCEVKMPRKMKRQSYTLVTSDWCWRLDARRHSDWQKLLRITAWVCRFVNNSRSELSLRISGELTYEELLDAEIYHISRAQREEFNKEVSALENRNQLSTSSKLLGLDPMLDEDGLIRCRGRLQHAKFLPFDAKFPIVLPRRNWVTKLIVKKCHEDGKHIIGTNQILALLSARYWIISAREEIREYEKECPWCRRVKAKPIVQIMAPLPQVRLKYSLRAFDQTGVDFAGPFMTIQGRGKQRVKRYLCLFTCLATRAVHLEMAYCLDSDSFLNAFYRMVNRRGLPSVVVSDNGTNFTGAVKELKLLVDQLDRNHIQSSLANRGVVWKFNPPYAPHFGGSFEAMIKASKRAIYAILGNSDITDEELITAFTGAESLINSRPLTYQSTHPNDDVPLTPNHFLHGQCGGNFAPESVDYAEFSPRRRWRRVQELVHHFWKRWMSEWLPSLQVRKKWFTPSRDLEVDDVVVVISPQSPRGSWITGRIIKTYPGRDGHVRVVDIQTNQGVMTRPVTKVCPLEWNVSETNTEECFRKRTGGQQEDSRSG
ncbi:uncharacterized protein [Haliotis asinina]|uniref:uncharacterized protein n=1 Tax=Haliotis asinina TaxID=109174 RepID=UPI00353211CA